MLACFESVAVEYQRILRKAGSMGRPFHFQSGYFDDSWLQAKRLHESPRNMECYRRNQVIEHILLFLRLKGFLELEPSFFHHLTKTGRKLALRDGTGNMICQPLRRRQSRKLAHLIQRVIQRLVRLVVFDCCHHLLKFKVHAHHRLHRNRPSTLRFGWMNNSQSSRKVIVEDK